MTTASVPLEQTEEGRRFLQSRVSMAGLFGAVIGFAFLLLRSVEVVLQQAWPDFYHPSFLFHVGGASSMAAVWLLCRSGQYTVTVVRTAESIGLLASSIFYSLMGSYIPEWQMPHYVVLLALQSMFVARAIWVPSTGRRTFALTVAAGVPMLAITHSMYANIDVTKWRLFEGIPEASASDVAFGITSFAALWWAATVAICAGASKLIYGLRKQVRDVLKLGQYELVEKLGEGGMGVVYTAKHAMLRRPTAVKLLPPDKAGESTIARFEKEVQQTARLTHPNTVTVFDYGRTPEGIFYYAMELLDGASLREVVELDGSQPPARVVRVLEQAASALSEAHAVGLIHRDIKPANIMLVKQGGELDVTKVLDFGLVKELHPEADLEVTQADSITGTPHYLSPEALTRPDTADARSDLYSLGAVGYYLLSGDQVFPGDNLLEVCGQHLHADPTPPSERLGGEVPADLETLIMQCLSKDPDSRPGSASELALGLRACRDFGGWSPDDAKRWWERHGDTLLERHSPQDAIPTGGETLEIDLAHRVDPSAGRRHAPGASAQRLR